MAAHTATPPTATPDIAAAMARVSAVLRKRPQAGIGDDAPALSAWQGGLRVATPHPGGSGQAVTDMPVELGGSGDQPSPGWLLRAALASCAVTRIAMAAAEAGISLHTLQVEISAAAAAPLLEPTAERVVIFHMITEGECWVELARSPRPGGAGVLAKLAELLFIEVLRLYMNGQGAARSGWLAGVNDRIVGAALRAMHSQPAQPWTLEALARDAGTSRSVLAERFQQLVGTSPMQHLAQWRMLLATHLLARSNAPRARIAEEVGYQTDTAFSRAFSREFGAPPAAWRRSQAARGVVL